MWPLRRLRWTGQSLQPSGGLGSRARTWTTLWIWGSGRIFCKWAFAAFYVLFNYYTSQRSSQQWYGLVHINASKVLFTPDGCVKIGKPPCQRCDKGWPCSLFGWLPGLGIYPRPTVRCYCNRNDAKWNISRARPQAHSQTPRPVVSGSCKLLRRGIVGKPTRSKECKTPKIRHWPMLNY